jgi:hypothetical protein
MDLSIVKWLRWGGDPMTAGAVDKFEIRTLALLMKFAGLAAAWPVIKTGREAVNWEAG